MRLQSGFVTMAAYTLLLAPPVASAGEARDVPLFASPTFRQDTIGRRRPDNEPRPGIYRVRSSRGDPWRLDLPPAMEDALDRATRDFEPWGDEDYHPSEIRDYDFSPRQTPWAVIGDFNGDGRLDAAVAGRDDRDVLIMVILSTGRRRYRALRADAEPYDPDDRLTIRPPILEYLYPGRYVIVDRRLRRPREIVVDRPAVQVTGGRRGGAVLYLVENEQLVPYYLAAAANSDRRQDQAPPGRRPPRS